MNLLIETPFGNRYRIHDNGDIQRLGGDHVTSGQWKLLGLMPVRGGAVIPRQAITPEWLAAHPLRYANGKPRYTGVDLDHGTQRIWGNTRYHGIRSIAIEF